MRTTITLFSIFIAVIMILTASVWNSGGSPGGKTGSPGDGGATCTQCHSGSNQQAAGWITSNIPPEGFIAEQSYTITAAATHTGAQGFGFEVTAENAAAAKQGTFIITNATETKLANAGRAVTHTFAGTTPSGNGKSWSFNWTAPASGAGPITFYGAFNAANGNGSTSGDVIYVSTLTVNEAFTAIEDVAGQAMARVYPNPFVNDVNVSLGEIKDEVKEIRMFSSNGTLVYAENISGIANSAYSIPTETIAKGFYQINILLQDGRYFNYTVIKK